MHWTSLAFAGALSSWGSSASANSLLGSRQHADARPMLLSPHLAPRNSSTTTTTTTPNLISRFLHRLEPRQAGRCGAEYGGQRCPGTQCCSSYGWCGDAFEHCGEIVGCQPQYGRCGNEPEPEPEPTPTPTPSPSSSTPVPSSTAIPPSSTVAPPLPSGTLIVSTNGQCGNATTCGGSPFGNCCSEWYFCGASEAYCGGGCRAAFGVCGGGGGPPGSSSAPPPSSTVRSTSTLPPVPSSSSSSSAAPPPPPSSSSRPAPPVPTVPVSQDGRCGNGVTCTGSTFGRCCSDYYWCGDQDDYCRTSYGCRPEWGSCGTQELFGGM